VIVTDRDGARGTIDTLAPAPDQAGAYTRVRLEGGEAILVQTELLVVRDPGHYELPLRFADLTARTGAGAETLVVPVVEETLEVEKHAVETGRVRISKTVTERQEEVDMPLLREEVAVERVAVNRVVTEPPAVRTEGDTLIVPLLEEELVVEKRLVLKEELRITRRQTETHQARQVTLRREEATVERIPSGESA